MKRSAAILWLAFLAATFAGGLLYLFNRRFSGGDAYPAYASLRTDSAGAKLIFESLNRLPGVMVARSYLPLDRLPDRDSTVLLLGLEPRAFAMQPDSELHSLEELAQRGNRLVLALGEASGRQPPNMAPLEKLWGVRVGLDFDKDGRGNPYFAEALNWEILERDGRRPLIIQRAFKKGSIVLVADGRLFSNQSLADATVAHALVRAASPLVGTPELLARIIGPHTRILFDESHFGIVESGSVVALARRFRLHGLALGLAIIAMLFIWKNASSFPPVSTAPREPKVFGRTSFAGLVTLLHRHIAPNRLASACWQEWLKTHARDIPSTRRAQAEDVLRRATDDPTRTLREIQVIVRAKGAI